MATIPNTDTYLIRTILARSLPILRETCIMPRLVKTDFGPQASAKGDTINIPVAPTRTAAEVTPAETPLAPSTTAFTRKQIKLDKWWSTNFHLSDQDRDQFDVSEHFIPDMAKQAVRALANKVNETILDSYEGAVWNWVGTAATTPFGTPGVGDAIDVARLLNENNAPKEERYAALNWDAWSAAMKLDEFHQAHIRGSDATITNGDVGRAFGIEWYGENDIQTHTKGTLVDAAGDMKACINDAAVAVGDTSVAMDEGTLTTIDGTVTAGDIFTVAGDTQTYTVTALATVDASDDITVSFSPPAKVAWTDNAVVTFKGSYDANLVWNRSAFGLASRPLDSDNPLSEFIMDPVTGLVLRLTKDYQFMQTAWYFDILWGVSCIQPEAAVILAG